MYKYCPVSLESTSNTNISIGVIHFFSSSTMSVLLNSRNILSLGEKVIVKIYNKIKGTVIYEAYISSITDNKIFLENILFVDEVERRTSTRININIPFEVDHVENNNGEIIELSKAIFMRGKNLSIEGILLESFLDIPDNINFIIKLPIKNTIINLKASTVRKYFKDKNYYYGCRLSFTNTNDKVFLAKYIAENFKMQAIYRNPRL